ncbi:MAG: glycine--tRNA ligase [Phycisphaerales bacterium]|nr:glycine--tRNA ligase [Phycisphaerales bacterium]
MSETSVKSMEAIVSLCKRRGFIYPASEIYGGINGFWDYGPLGAQLKKNLRDAWWQDMIMNPCWGRSGPDGDRVRCVPVETRIIQHPRVWEASGHVGGFNDPMQTCKQCKKLLRADHVPDLLAESEWVASLAGVAGRAAQEQVLIEGTEVLKWTGGKGKKLAANLAIYRDAEASVRIVAKLRETTTPIALAEVIRIIGNTSSAENPWPCPICGGELTEPRPFNLMFPTVIGATGDWESDRAYLRPETAQGIFVQFKNVVDTTRVKVPFGIGNTGTSFRNEVTPRNFTFRSREFEQAELEFFCHPEESQEWYRFWRDFRMEWWQSIGLRGDNLILREHEKDELSHYSTGTSDVEYRFPFTAPGFGELEGIAHRGCFDLTQHQQFSGTKLDYFDTDRGETLPNGSKKGERYIPHVIEPAAGLDRGALALLCEAYTRDESRPSPEIMRFHPRMAPIKAAVFPLVNKDGMPEVAEKLHAELFRRFGHAGFIETDAKQSIGKRYARMDEAGCPYCFTIDGQTLTDQTVTVRDRDTGGQERIGLDKVKTYLEERLGV